MQKCPFRDSKQVKRNGCRNGKQRYKCHACGRRLNPQEIWQAYSEGKQTAAQLAKTYGCSRQTILRHLKKV
ncbi:IS1/IS1595 family N-terminal zinc-binding domain-containing protein, partial [Neisseria mucosa]|uniref:IS1/IS1595 family N-terminal zinc-binding domain-containing protein n=1 Tax=Neisseria mucosa TaxID=488 RepID=UPI00163DC57D